MSALSRGFTKALQDLHKDRYAHVSSKTRQALIARGLVIEPTNGDGSDDGLDLSERGHWARITGHGIDHRISSGYPSYPFGSRELWAMRFGDSFTNYDRAMPLHGGYVIMDGMMSLDGRMTIHHVDPSGQVVLTQRELIGIARFAEARMHPGTRVLAKLDELCRLCWPEGHPSPQLIDCLPSQVRGLQEEFARAEQDNRALRDEIKALKVKLKELEW